jgi:hypothetical protein
MNAYSVLAVEPATERLVGIPGPVLQGLLLLLALGLFAFILARRLLLLAHAAPDDRQGRLGDRVRSLIVMGFGQARQPRYLVAGVLHILVFFGFLILSLRSLTLLGEGFVEGFTLPPEMMQASALKRTPSGVAPAATPKPQAKAG